MDNLESVEDLTTLWNFDESVDDLKKQLLRVTNDVLLAKKESKEQERIKMEQVKKLVHLLAIAYKERDEAKHRLHILSMVKSQTLPPCSLPMTTTTTTTKTPATKQEQPFTSSVIAHVLTGSNACSLPSSQSITLPPQQPQCGINTNPTWIPCPNVTTIVPTMPPHNPRMMVDNPSSTTIPSSIDSRFAVSYSTELYYFGNSDNLNCANSCYDHSTILDNLAKGRPRPEKGKLLQSVMDAGPLLDSLLMAGPMPQWSNPPQLAHAPQVPPVPISMSKRPRYYENLN